ncbi:MAG TPA: PAS domain S-box protein [Thermoanaerobaculia bacterium]|nr:PAS domain S-box protein [Thermoanaerobaculia bacterium]
MFNLASSAEKVLASVIEDAKDFVFFLLDARGRIATWNRGAELMFGYKPEDAIGQYFGFLFTKSDRDQGAPEREIETARRTGRAEDTRWHLRSDGSVFFVDGVNHAVRDESGAVAGFAKIGRDVTDRYRTEQRLAAQLTLTNLLIDDRPVEITAQRVIQAVCENLRWDLGALWSVDEERKRIRHIDHWHSPEVDPEGAAALYSNSIEFEQGVGLPGRVWAGGEPAWFTDLTDSTAFPRGELAARVGFRAAFAFPITHEGRVTGAMEFFSRDDREPDQPLIPILTLIGAQIGDYIARRGTAETLRESEERYRLVSHTAHDAIFTIDEASVVLSCNPAVERIFGYKPEELIGLKLETIIPDRYRQAHRRGIEHFLQTRQRRIPWDGVELPAQHRDGHEFPVEIAFGEFTSGSRTIFTGFARDITERKRVASELKASLELEQRARSDAEAVRNQLERRAEEESSFRHLASALTGAVEMTDVLFEITNRATLVTRADGVYVERIMAGSRFVEVVASAGRGTPPRGLRVAFPGSVTDEMITGRQPVVLAEMSGMGQSMAPYLSDTCPRCQILVTPLIAEEEPLGALVLLNSRQSGREFGDADILRARTLGDLTSLALRRVRLLELEREAKERAEAAVRVRDETLGIVSHDLRNPLTQIALSADLLASAKPGEQGELIETIRTAARQMDRLIQDLLDVARLEAGRFSVDRSVIDAKSLAREACESQRPVAEQRRLQIVCEIADDLPEICADRDRILQVFGNLIANAMKFTPERGSIFVRATSDIDGVMFSVADTGPGIPEADLKNLFRPYWQAKKTAHMGAGLGLAIVRGIVEAHGGRVWATNERGSGAVFTFTIPKA